jgi:hypothetical protein
MVSSPPERPVLPSCLCPCFLYSSVTPPILIDCKLHGLDCTAAWTVPCCKFFVLRRPSEDAARFFAELFDNSSYCNPACVILTAEFVAPVPLRVPK